MNIDDILGSMSQASGMSVEQLLEDTRRKDIVSCRDLMFLYLYSTEGLSTPQIGKIFNRDHATVLHGIKMAKVFLTTPSYKQESEIWFDFLQKLQDKYDEKTQRNNMIDTNDSDAPWNQREPAPVSFDKKVNVYLSKEMELSTTYYEEHVDCDGNHYCTESRGETNWESEFKQEHMGIPELLEVLEKQAQIHMAEIERDIKHMDPFISPQSKLSEYRRWEKILKDCQGWKVEEIEIDDP